ncbi:MAG: Gfo/Idh/MocA family protein [bacterium]|jgi:predicted dehydrogenase
MTKTNDENYGIAKIADLQPVDAPDLPYQPQDPQSYRPRIGLIGCGGVTVHHLRVYKEAGYDVVALCDIDSSKAQERQQKFYPQAQVYSDYRDLLNRADIEVVDIATHPRERVEIIETALKTGKHVLSQKPFVLDLDQGERLADLADSQGVQLAVNQNGRWAPHFSYMRQAMAAGMIGEVLSAHLSVHWDHSWVCGTEFENMRHLILYDFGIHWFDMVNCFMGDKNALKVYASIQRSCNQKARPAMLAHAVMDFDGAQASLIFNGDTRFGPQDGTYISGTAGTMTSVGPDLMEQRVTLYNQHGYCSPVLEGHWFPQGFHGAMGELLCAIEQSRTPINNARDNLKTLALCFAAVASAEQGQAIVPGACRKMTE